MQKTLVIGYGSIGARHVRILKELGLNTKIMSRRKGISDVSFISLEIALQEWEPEYIIVANETEKHLNTLQKLEQLGFVGQVLMEKPISHLLPPQLPQFSFDVFVAYNLRFHPIFFDLQNLLYQDELISVQVYVGQYLPNWRPETNYVESYSISKKKGGGVLRDLSHELDYIHWLFGKWKSLTAQGGHWSDLVGDSDDVFALMLQTEHCPLVVLQMNYLDRKGRREILINGKKNTYRVDLVRNELEINQRIKKYHVGRDTTYRLQHQAMLEKQFCQLCSLQEGWEVMRVIEATEIAAETKTWISR